MPANLYVHFPFCRRKCSYCALYSRVGVSQSDRDAYVRRLAAEIESLRVNRASGKVTPRHLDAPRSSADARMTFKDSGLTLGDARMTLTDAVFETVYFGGGSPALCDLRPLLKALREGCASARPPVLDDRRPRGSAALPEFTVELHPLDVTEDLLKTLRAGGVNRISMGVQSLNDATLADMGRGYTLAEAERAFALVKRHFDNAGIDLIVGYPGDEVEVKSGGGQWNLQRLSHWGLRHCSVYSLQNERGLKNVPDDDTVLDWLRHIAIRLGKMGLERYEISNYAVPGFECRHNLAVWRGEDYIGLGDGACGRIGLKRTKFGKEEIVTPEFDVKERNLFRLRTREGLDLRDLSHLSNASNLSNILATQVAAGLLVKSGDIYRLTERGMEVCDSILAELV